MKLRMTLAAILAGALAAPVAFAQPGDRHDRHDDRDHDRDRDRDRKDDRRADVHVDEHGAHAVVHVTVPPVGEHGRREWRIEHPVVTGYRAIATAPGGKVVIRGQHFRRDMVVVWGGKPVPGATVSETEISFVVPANAPNGAIYIRGEGLDGDLPIADYQASAADRDVWRKRDADRQLEGEAAWKAREREFKKDRRERDAELERQEEALEHSREERRERYLADIQARFDQAFLESAAVQAELAFHAERQAKLERISRLVADTNDPKLGVRVEVDIRRENERHENRMTALKASFKGG